MFKLSWDVVSVADMSAGRRLVVTLWDKGRFFYCTVFKWLKGRIQSLPGSLRDQLGSCSVHLTYRLDPQPLSQTYSCEWISGSALEVLIQDPTPGEFPNFSGFRNLRIIKKARCHSTPEQYNSNILSVMQVQSEKSQHFLNQLQKAA